jgi:hypothetical protein
MKQRVRSIVDIELYDIVRKLVNYPQSTSFNDSLIELTRQFKEMKKK